MNKIVYAVLVVFVIIGVMGIFWNVGRTIGGYGSEKVSANIQPLNPALPAQGFLITNENSFDWTNTYLLINNVWQAPLGTVPSKADIITSGGFYDKYNGEPMPENTIVSSILILTNEGNATYIPNEKFAPKTETFNITKSPEAESGSTSPVD